MFEIGDIVRFKYTGFAAEIIEDYNDGSYAVWLEEDNEESIAFDDDIVLDKDFKKIEESEQQKTQKKAPKGLSTEELFYSKGELEAKRNVSFQKKTPKTNKLGKAKVQEDIFIPPPIVYTTATGTGCYLAFYPTSTINYTIYLINDTTTSFRFEFKLFLKKQLEHGFNKLIPANTFFAIGEFSQDQFNDSPSIEFKCPKFHFEKSIKLKYKKFAGTQKAVPLMGLSTYNFLLFNSLHASQKKSSSISDYTNEYKKEQAELIEPVQSLYHSFDLMDVASFDNEVDLHAEKLVTDTSEFTPKELYELQLEVLDTFIYKASELGLKKVFVIHGLGKGRLQKGVEDYLRYHNDVKSFKNEFHEKYGFGATSVRLK
jgi:hypothetical protein